MIWEKKYGKQQIKYIRRKTQSLFERWMNEPPVIRLCSMDTQIVSTAHELNEKQCRASGWFGPKPNWWYERERLHFINVCIQKHTKAYSDMMVHSITIYNFTYVHISITSIHFTGWGSPLFPFHPPNEMCITSIRFDMNCCC